MNIHIKSEAIFSFIISLMLCWDKCDERLRFIFDTFAGKTSGTLVFFQLKCLLRQWAHDEIPIRQRKDFTFICFILGFCGLIHEQFSPELNCTNWLQNLTKAWVNFYNVLGIICVITCIRKLTVNLAISLQEKHVKENQINHWRTVIKLQDKLKEVLKKVWLFIASKCLLVESHSLSAFCLRPCLVALYISLICGSLLIFKLSYDISLFDIRWKT